MHSNLTDKKVLEMINLLRFVDMVDLFIFLISTWWNNIQGQKKKKKA